MSGASCKPTRSKAAVGGRVEPAACGGAATRGAIPGDFNSAGEAEVAACLEPDGLDVGR
jgi:hypothetical protein